MPCCSYTGAHGEDERLMQLAHQSSGVDAPRGRCLFADTVEAALQMREAFPDGATQHCRVVVKRLGAIRHADLAKQAPTKRFFQRGWEKPHARCFVDKKKRARVLVDDRPREAAAVPCNRRGFVTAEVGVHFARSGRWFLRRLLFQPRTAHSWPCSHPTSPGQRCGRRSRALLRP